MADWTGNFNNVSSQSGIDWSKVASDAGNAAGWYGNNQWWVDPLVGGIGTAAGLVGGAWLLSGGPGRMTGRWGKRAGQLGDFMSGLSDALPGDNPTLDRWAGNQYDKQRYWQDWYPGKVINEGLPGSNRDPLVDPNTIKNIPDNIGNAIDQGLSNTGELIDKYKMEPGSIWEGMQDPENPMYNNPERYAQNYLLNFDPSGYGQTIAGDVAEREQYGPMGERYSQTEADALSALQNQGQNYAKEMGENVSTYQGLLKKPETDIEKAYQSNLLAAQQGKMTAADNEWFQNQSALIDRQAEDEVKKLKESAGAAGGLRSGMTDRRIQEVYDRARESKNALLSTAQRDMAGRAQDFINSSNTASNDVNQIAAALAQSAGTGKSAALNQTLGHISNAAQIATTQTGQKLEQDRLLLDAEMNKMKGLMTDAQWQNEYDLNVKNTYFDNFTSLISTIMNSVTSIFNILGSTGMTSGSNMSDIIGAGGIPSGIANQKAGQPTAEQSANMLKNNPGLLGGGNTGGSTGGTYKQGTGTPNIATSGALSGPTGGGSNKPGIVAGVPASVPKVAGVPASIPKTAGATTTSKPKTGTAKKAGLLGNIKKTTTTKKK